MLDLSWSASFSILISSLPWAPGPPYWLLGVLPHHVQIFLGPGSFCLFSHRPGTWMLQLLTRRFPHVTQDSCRASVLCPWPASQTWPYNLFSVPVSPPFHGLLLLVFSVIKAFSHQTLAPQNQVLVWLVTLLPQAQHRGWCMAGIRQTLVEWIN